MVEPFNLFLGFSLLACCLVLLHGVYRYTRRQLDEVQIWLTWCIAGVAGFLAVGSAGVAIWSGFGAEHPESGLALGAGALIGCWAAGIIFASARASENGRR